ncbi:MAG TPA: hypothetical protein PLJ21_12405 [Pseudobdellovibrionaceae bacterium]|nr:hypothetical protein [Pseudobdellovibrionaceae bacterium]
MLNFIFIFYGLLFLHVSPSFSFQETPRLQATDIEFNLIPTEPGPEWQCTHREIKNLPLDWRVTCQSLNSTAKSEFLVHFLMRQNQNPYSNLEILYWVDEQNFSEKRSKNLNHGQTTLINYSGEMNPKQLSLGQFVQNGTSLLNITVRP